MTEVIGKPTRTYSTQGPECPYCGNLITPDESYYYDEHVFTEAQCPECDKTFKVEVDTHTSWRCDPVDQAKDSAANQNDSSFG